MIVIASHNRIDLLENMIKRLKEIDLNNHRVLIVDTNSDNEDYKKQFKKLQYQYPEFIFNKKDYTCWDSGAYIHAYRTYVEDSFIFLQDSLTITNNYLIPIIDGYLKNYEVVPFINFGYGYENEAQKEFAEQELNVTSLPNWGIFGPIFGIRTETLDKLPKEWLIEPYDKNTGCGMERRWSLMFHLMNIPKHYLEIEDHLKNHNIYTSKQFIDKHFFYRL
jgi:hypothetical protein